MFCSVVNICRPRRPVWVPSLTGCLVRKWSSTSLVRRSPQISCLPCGHDPQQTPGVLGTQFTQTPSRLQIGAVPSCMFQTSCQAKQTETGQSTQHNEQLISQMNIRLVNENSFLSWCRNAYLSTVVGVAMMAEGASSLAQGAGLGALLVGTMNLAWGTGCHVTNLVRLRHVSGMSKVTLFLHLAGSSLHCLLWAFVLICYIGFLDESRWPAEDDETQPGSDGGKQKSRLGEGLRRV